MKSKIILSCKQKIKTLGVGLMVTAFTFNNFYIPISPTAIAATQQSNNLQYTVVKGDTLYLISKKFGTTIDALMSKNNLNSSEIWVGQNLEIPSLPVFKLIYQIKPGETLHQISSRFGISISDIMSENNLTTAEIWSGQVLKIPIKVCQYKVQSSDTLALIAQKFDTTIYILKSLNNLDSDLLYIDQNLIVPIPHNSTSNQAVNLSYLGTCGEYIEYTVSPGDTLYLISKKFETTVNELSTLNTIESPNNIIVGQKIIIPSISSSVDKPVELPVPPDTDWTIPPGTILVHVKPGQTLKEFALKYHTTVDAIMITNHLHNEWLNIGQPLFIPYNTSTPVQVSAPRVPVKPGFGEWLDWEYVNWIFDMDNQAVIEDLETGKQFKIKRLGGSQHADSEPLTWEDTKIMKEIFGGYWSWNSRPVLVRIDDRVLAGSINGMPHSVQTIYDNGFPGHFCLHFLNSRLHLNNELSPTHQANIQKAAGY